jgi:hypothetical protein
MALKAKSEFKRDQGNIGLREMVKVFLSANPEKRFTARQIGDFILSNYPEFCEKKKLKSKVIESDSHLVQQFVAEIGANRPEIQKLYPEIKTTESRPRMYYWSLKSEEDQVSDIDKGGAFKIAGDEKSDPDINIREYDLYPVLANYLRNELGLFPKRIDEKKSSNRSGPQGNKWLFPDLVAIENLTDGMNRNVKELVSVAGLIRVKYYSLEVKIILNRSNVRQAFFQSVSNSSWANFGYLVTTEISGEDTIKELRMLSSLHGIGLMMVNIEDFTESQIIIPAKERIDIDLNTCSRLAEENKDFSEFVKAVRQFHQTGDLNEAWWDGKTEKVQS